MFCLSLIGAHTDGRTKTFALNKSHLDHLGKIGQFSTAHLAISHSTICHGRVVEKRCSRGKTLRNSWMSSPEFQKKVIKLKDDVKITNNKAIQFGQEMKTGGQISHIEHL